MVEFLRDVIIAVAILASLIALAFHLNQDSDSGRNAVSADNRIGISAAPNALGGANPPLAARAK